MTLEDARVLDAADPLAPFRDRFLLPDGLVYMDGNSLGPLTKAAAARARAVVETEWGEGLIRSWNSADWIDLPRRVGDRIATLIGAEPGTVLAADSTSINIFKLLAIAAGMRPDRGTILLEAGDFPTDRYIAEGFASLNPQKFGLLGHKIASGDITAPTPDVGVVLVTEVNYRTGARHDMAAVTQAAHDAGALVIWDLCHSAGAFPVDVAGTGADFAVGCGYKYLNGGPGAPAFAYVAPRHLDGLRQPLSGWMGHARPFAFADDYEPAAGIDALRVGTPPILSLSTLDAALDAFDGVDLAALRAKADALFDLFVANLPSGIELLTPTDPRKRGTQVSLCHPQAYAVMQALIARGIIGDFREPDILRFGLTPLTLRFEDVWRATTTLADVLATGAWDRPEFRARAKVV
ncbi:MAG: kynureninase [Devosia sp.]